MKPASKTWREEPWPWLLMAGPAAVVIAGLITGYLAVVTNDGLVADDYYKRGLAINQVLSRDALARERGMSARLDVSASGRRLTATLFNDQNEGRVVVLHFSHAARSALDHTVRLERISADTFAAELPAFPAGRWHVTLEDPSRTWRLAGVMPMHGSPVLTLTPR